MGPKKKEKDKEDSSTKKLFSQYKKTCFDNEYKMYKPLEDTFKEKIKEDSHINEIFIPETLGPEKTDHLFNTLSLVKDKDEKLGYKHLQSLRLWQSQILDDGVPAIFNYLETVKAPNLKILELKDCNIGVEGCQLISEMLNPLLNSDIQILSLDNNRFGLEGLIQLMNNLKINETIVYLSLADCDLDAESILYFKEFFQNDKNKLVSLILDGNAIETRGACDLLKILNPTNKLEEISLCFCKIISNEEFILCVTSAMQELNMLEIYNLEYNTLNDEFLLAVTEVLKKQKLVKDLHVYQFKTGVFNFSDTVFQPFYKLMLGRKKPKKKKAKKTVKK